MSETNVLLLRHGQSEGNERGQFGGHGPTPLTALGVAQAQRTAQTIGAEGGLSTILSSDLTRAVETARPISELIGVDVTVTADLRERSVGQMTGLTFEEAQQQYPDAFAALMRRDPEACPPGGESHATCAARAIRAFDQVVDRFAGGRILVVSHAATLYLLLRHIFGLSDSPQSPRLFFQTDNCALHRFSRLSEGVWKVKALNDRGHLTTLRPVP